MRRLVGPVLIALALALAAPPAASIAAAYGGALTLTVQAPPQPDCRSAPYPCTRPTVSAPTRAVQRPAPRRIPPPVELKVIAGYNGQFRASAWVPVRVTVHNRTSTVQRGTVAVPDGGAFGQWSTPSYSVLYQTPIDLPPGSTKQVALYVPGRDIHNGVDVQFRTAGRAVATASGSLSSFDDQTIAIGALVDASWTMSWLRHFKPQNSTVHVVRLRPATVDPVAEALASFDAIVLTNVDTSRLDSEQSAAIERYVRDGGSLILVGGPDWQETLRPLSPALLPGDLTGSRTVPDLSGLQALAGSALPRHESIVSVLAHPRGSVLAGEAGIPLIVRNRVGRGRVIYLAFDPAIDRIPRRSGGGDLLTDLILQAAPQVVSRLSQGGLQVSFFPGRFGPTMIHQELANVPAATLHSMFLLILLAIGSVLLLGPFNFLLLHRLGRQELAWMTIPALALLCLGSTLTVAAHLKGNAVLLNTVGVIELDGATSRHSATLYAGLIAPQPGDYQLVWNSLALPQGLPGYARSQGSGSATSPVGLRLQEGAQTAVDFPSMRVGSERSVALNTTVTIPGTVNSELHLTPDGSLSGVVRNTTNLTLIYPVIIAGSAFVRLSSLPPQGTQTVRIRPSVESHRYFPSLIWDRIYGPSPTSSSLGSWDGDPWEEPQPTAERSVIDRLRNVAERLPEARDITSSGQILFAGWSEDPLGAPMVNGAPPQRRDLNLIVAPLSVHFPQGSFHLRAGTLGAYLIDDQPRQPENGCCFSSSTGRSIAVGAGGSVTFQFDLPHDHPVHFRSLTLATDAGSSNATNIGQAYDWHAGRWAHINLQSGSTALSTPDRFISASGALQVRLRATSDSGDLVIRDPRRDLQLSGWAQAS